MRTRLAKLGQLTQFSQLTQLKFYIAHVKKSGMRNADFNILNFILYGILYDTMFNIYRPFMPTYIRRLGGGELHISLLNALPGFVAIFTVLPGAMFLRRFSNKKRVTAILFAISRSFLLLFALVPAFPPAMRPIMFLIFLAAMNLPDAISQTSFQNYLGSLFNPYSRSTAISNRTKFGNMAVLLVTLATGAVLNGFAKTEAGKIMAYQVFFILAFLFGLLEIFVFTRFKEDKTSNNHAAPAPEIVPDFKSSMKGIFSDKRFLSYLGATIVFYFGWHMGWPLGSLVFVTVLQASELWLGVNMGIAVIGVISAASFWNRKIHKHGNNLVLGICAAGISVTIVVTVVVPNVFLFLVTTFVTNFFLAGLTVAILNGLLEATPSESRMLYIGVYNTFVNISLAVAPLCAHFLVQNVGYLAAGVTTGAIRLIGAGLVCLLSLSYKKKLAVK